MNAQEIVLDDVYGVWKTPFWQTPAGYAILVLLTLILLALVYGLYKLIKARRGSTKEQSLRSLRVLADKYKKGSVETKRVYQELTGTIKLYSQWRYGLPRGMTDYELTALLATVGCEKPQQEDVCRIVADAQMIKFGQVEALKSQVNNDIATVVSFIEHTAKGK